MYSKIKKETPWTWKGNGKQNKKKRQTINKKKATILKKEEGKKKAKREKKPRVRAGRIHGGDWLGLGSQPPLHDYATDDARWRRRGSRLIILVGGRQMIYLLDAFRPLLVRFVLFVRTSGGVKWQIRCRKILGITRLDSIQINRLLLLYTRWRLNAPVRV